MRIPGIRLIWAEDANGVIGDGKDLAIHDKDDLKRFKEITEGQIVIMGRKTWESLPKKPLPNRRNIVMTTKTGYEAPGAEVAYSLSHVMQLVGRESRKKIWVIGGKALYEMFAPYAEFAKVTRFKKAAELETPISMKDCLNEEDWELSYPPYEFDNRFECEFKNHNVKPFKPEDKDPSFWVGINNIQEGVMLREFAKQWRGLEVQIGRYPEGVTVINKGYPLEMNVLEQAFKECLKRYRWYMVECNVEFLKEIQQGMKGSYR